MDKSKQGKKNKAAGKAFELKVRKDLEAKGWIIAKWSNNVEFEEDYDLGGSNSIGKLIPAKHKFNFFTKVMAMGTGFPDFIGFWVDKKSSMVLGMGENKLLGNPAFIIGVEAKSNGHLDKKEKSKCNWLLVNKIFSKIIIAKKGLKRGQIDYEEFAGTI